MTNVSAGADGKLKIFISYSRKDEDFAQELLAGLELAGFEPYLDKHDIAAGEDWDWLDCKRARYAPPLIGALVKSDATRH
jgi:hypothetical protein